MSYKTLLTVLRSLDEAKRVMPAVAQLAREHDAHVIACHAEASPVAYATPAGFIDAATIEAGMKACEERAAAIKQYMETAAAAEGINVEWRSSITFGGDSGVAALPTAHAADLIVAGQTDPSDASGSAVNLEALLFESGRPVFFVPYAAARNMDPKHVVVAWNGTCESARAAFDALPFIRAAKKVDLVLVDAPTTEDQDGPAAGADIAAALARHGAEVDVINLHAADISVAAVLLNHVSDTGAGLLVMGAYSHSRLREMIFGGVTRTILNSMIVPVVMSH